MSDREKNRWEDDQKTRDQNEKIIMILQNLITVIAETNQKKYFWKTWKIIYGVKEIVPHIKISYDYNYFELQWDILSG